MSTLNTAPVPILEARKLEKFYPQPDGSRIQVNAATDLAVYPGQIIALLGGSGSGKIHLAPRGMPPSIAASALRIIDAVGLDGFPLAPPVWPGLLPLQAGDLAALFRPHFPDCQI
jgi:hypothetical protein